MRGEEGEGNVGEVVQTMYTHVIKYKNDKMYKKKIQIIGPKIEF
jgi:hypothetical protein